MRDLSRVTANVSLLLLVAFGSTVAIAQQPCTPDVVMSTKRGWKPNAEAILKPGPNETAINVRLGKELGLLMAAYEPTGTDANWDRPFAGTQAHNGLMPSELRAFFFAYRCSGRPPSVLGRGIETSTWFYVWTNKFSWFFDPAAAKTWTLDERDPVLLVSKKAGEVRGYQVYEGLEMHNTNSNQGITGARTLILTRSGESPFVPVTKRELLTSIVAFIDKKKAEIMAASEKAIRIRPEAEQEAKKQAALASIEKHTSPGWRERERARYLKGYQTDQQRKDSMRAGFAKLHDGWSADARNLLASLSEAEARQPAIVLDDPLGFKSFATEDQGGNMLVRMNPKYFNRALAKDVPQFFVVYWRWDANPPGLEFKKQLEANFDFKALQAMIDR